MAEPQSIFSDKDRTDIAEGFRQDDVLTIGGKRYEVRPLNAKGMKAAFSLIKDLADKLGAAANDSLGGAADSGDRVAKIVTAVTTIVSENIDLPAQLMHIVLSRNAPGLDLDKFEEDVEVDDFLRFWEIFTRQNKVDVLVGKIKALPGVSEIAKGFGNSISPSSNSPTSFAGITDGQNTSLSDDVPIGGETTN